jgi:hypothetical protein
MHPETGVALQSVPAGISAEKSPAVLPVYHSGSGTVSVSYPAMDACEFSYAKKKNVFFLPIRGTGPPKVKPV